MQTKGIMLTLAIAALLLSGCSGQQTQTTTTTTPPPPPPPPAPLELQMTDCFQHLLQGIMLSSDAQARIPANYTVQGDTDSSAYANTDIALAKCHKVQLSTGENLTDVLLARVGVWVVPKDKAMNGNATGWRYVTDMYSTNATLVSFLKAAGQNAQLATLTGSFDYPTPPVYKPYMQTIAVNGTSILDITGSATFDDQKGITFKVRYFHDSASGAHWMEGAENFTHMPDAPDTSMGTAHAGFLNTSPTGTTPQTYIGEYASFEVAYRFGAK